MVVIGTYLHGDISHLKKLANKPHPFNYDLHLKMLPASQNNEEVLICLHGMGSDHQLADIMRDNPAIPYNVIGFNFPDYGDQYSSQNMLQTTFGTIQELLPFFYVLKLCVIDAGIEKIHLYGFSSGGGALVNALSVLNTDRYDHVLVRLGIGTNEKKLLLDSVQKGSVILEVPLRSFDELADLFNEEHFRPLAQRAMANGMTPIENLKNLHSLSLNIFVYFSDPDESLGNRDDKIYIRRLRDANRDGKTTAIIGKSKGHLAYHGQLWKEYNLLKQKK